MPIIPSNHELLGTGTSGHTHSTTSYATSRSQDTIRHELTDALAGGFGGMGSYGTVNYAAKSLTVRLVDLSVKTNGYKSDYENSDEFDGASRGGASAKKGGAYSDTAVGEQLLAASTVTVSYAIGFATVQSAVESFSAPPVTIDLCPYTADYIVPGSVRFSWMGQIYEDYDGQIWRNRTLSDPGILSGLIRYASGIVELTDYTVSGNPKTTFVLQSLWTMRQPWTTASIFMRTQTSPIKPTGFVMNLSDTEGASITATGDLAGNITGLHLRGKMDYETGVVELQFGDYVLDTSLTAAQKLEWWYNAADVGIVPGQALKIWRPWPVDPTTLRYNSIAFFYLPVDAELLGIDPVRLPPDGRVPIFRRGGDAVLGHTGTITATVTNGQTINAGRVRLSRWRVMGSNGIEIPAGYTEDLEAGTITFTSVAGMAQPLTIQHRIEDMVKVSDVQINGQLTFTRQLTHAYPLGSFISSALMTQDLKARVSIFFDQATWDGVSWIDSLVGNQATATYNDTLAPVLVTNQGALTERWAIRFTNTTSFEVIGQNVGTIATGTTGANCAPINPATGVPYFTLAALGWGSGWAAGNILRLNTVGAGYPLWLVRTIQAGAESVLSDKFTLLVRGGVDRP